MLEESISNVLGREMAKNLEIVDVTPSNVGEYGLCGFRKPAKSVGYERNRDWLRKRFAEGMKVKVLHSEEVGTVGFVEYVPGEYSVPKTHLYPSASACVSALGMKLGARTLRPPG